MNWKGLVSVLLGWSLAFAAESAVVSGLYDVEVGVERADSSVLTEAFRDGLRQVIDVLTGGRQGVHGHPLVRQALETPDKYVEQYSFERVDRQASEPDNQRASYPYVVRIRFLQNAVVRLLGQASIPVWGSSRPTILVWVVRDSGLSRRILPATDSDPLIESITENGRYMHVPLIFPVMDLEDEMRISASDIWGEFLEQVRAASDRYSPDGIALLKVVSTPGGLETARATLVLGQQIFRFDIESKESALVAREFVRQLAQLLSEKFAILMDSEATGSVSVQVTGVNRYADYVALTKFLGELAPVIRVVPSFISGSTAYFSIAVHGSPDQLAQYIALDRKLKPEYTTSSMGNNARLSYVWQP